MPECPRRSSNAVESNPGQPDGPTIRLVPLEWRHLAKTLEWNNDAQLMRLLNRAQPISEAEHEQWFARLPGLKGCLYFAIEEGTEAGHVGNVWLWEIDPRHRRCELRILIGETPAQGRGLGTQAIALACAYASEHLNLHRIYAYVLSINPHARRAFERAGFEREGTLRADRRCGDCYVDTWLMGKLL